MCAERIREILNAGRSNLDEAQYQSQAAYSAWVHNNVFVANNFVDLETEANIIQQHAAALDGIQVGRSGEGRTAIFLNKKNTDEPQRAALKYLFDHVMGYLPAGLRPGAWLDQIWLTRVGAIRRHPDTHLNNVVEPPNLAWETHPRGRMCTRLPVGDLEGQVVRFRSLKNPQFFVDMIAPAGCAYMASPKLAEECSHEILFSGGVMLDVIFVLGFPPDTNFEQHLS